MFRRRASPEKVVPYQKRARRRVVEKVRRFGEGPRRPRSWPRLPLGMFIMPAFGLIALIAAPFAGDAMKGMTTEMDACSVVAVVDGDTVKLACPGEGVRTARLIGFDTPEVFSPRCLREFWLGARSTWELRLLIWGADAVHVRRQGRDRYGRDLVRVSLDGVDVARSMVESGLARRYAGGLRGSWCT